MTERALLLDRDGVINVDHGYVGDPERFEFMEGIFPLARAAAVAAVLHCPYLSGGPVAPYARDSFWRKPNPGMIMEAARQLNLDLSKPIIIGDSPSNMTAARAAGVGLRLLLSAAPVPDLGDADHVIARLADALPFLSRTTATATVTP